MAKYGHTVVSWLGFVWTCGILTMVIAKRLHKLVANSRWLEFIWMIWMVWIFLCRGKHYRCSVVISGHPGSHLSRCAAKLGAVGDGWKAQSTGVLFNCSVAEHDRAWVVTVVTWSLFHWHEWHEIQRYCSSSVDWVAQKNSAHLSKLQVEAAGAIHNLVRAQYARWMPG